MTRLLMMCLVIGLLTIPAWALKIEKGVVVNKKTCDVVTWTDAAGKERSVALVKSTGDVGKYTGSYIEQYTYFIGDKKIIAKSDEVMSGVSGLGCSVDHHADGAAISKANSTKASDSFILEGANHCIWRFKSELNGPGGGKDDKHPIVLGLVIDYYIADGRSDILWSVSYDMSKLKDGEASWDARGPYFQFDWDGDGKFFGTKVSGIRWGDKYKFKTTTMSGTSSSWDYTEKNVMPYMMLYKEGDLGDAEAGVIQTVPWTYKDAGGYWWSKDKGWGKTGDGMMENWNCPYQLNAYEDYASEKMAWGSPYGTVGVSKYQTLDFQTTGKGYPYQGYATLIILNKHSEALTDKMIASLENSMKTKLKAIKGTIPTAGPRYAGIDAKEDYCTPGWDGAYGQWIIDCKDNQAEVEFDTGSGTVLTPTICFSDFTAAKATITRDGKEIAEGKDYYATIDKAGKRLLVTFVKPFEAGKTTIAVK